MRRALFPLAAVLATVLAAVDSPAAAPLPGWIGRAGDGTRQVAFVAPTPNFTLAADESVHPQLGPAFRVEWSGLITLVRGGRYTLLAPGKVFIDGAEITGRPADLSAGQRAVRIEFQRPPGPVRFQLEWEADFFPREPVPARLLTHEPVPELAPAAQLELGRQLVERLHCTACHPAPGPGPTGPRGPDLSQAGERLSPAWIRRWLENPRQFRAEAAMPVVPATEQERADVTAYLATLRSRPAPPAGTPGRAQEGQALFGSIGCQACHEDQRHSLAGVGSKFRDAAALARYLADPLAVDASGRMPDLNLSRAEAADLAAHLVRSRNPDFESPAPTGDPARGRALVVSAGCVNCHSLTDAQGTLRPQRTTVRLDAADPTRGCLAETPPASAPRYPLNAAERAALRAYVKSPDRSPAPVQEFQRAMTAFQCNACHEWNGPARLRTEPAPPSLTDSGNKLRASWLEEVLLRHKRVRPWMTLRMPHYGPAAAPLVPGFAAQAGALPGEGPVPPAPTPEQIEAGVKWIGSGEGGLSCINCHDFKGEPSPGQMRGPDLTEMNARIRTDWLRRWLREPARIQEGTAMPAFFTDLPADRAGTMIEQIIHALAAGRDMPTPPGWGTPLTGYLVKVTDEPVLVRTFLPECSPRGIAVGLPGGQSYCFDAAFALLRYAWRGEFLDAKGAWAERGGQVSTPLGPVWFKATSHPLRIGDPGAEPRVRFRGYRLERGVPVFHYELNGVPVTEKITATRDGRGLQREFTLTGATGEITVRDPGAPGVSATTSVGEFVNGRLRLPAAPTVQFTLTLVPQ